MNDIKSNAGTFITPTPNTRNINSESTTFNITHTQSKTPLPRPDQYPQTPNDINGYRLSGKDNPDLEVSHFTQNRNNLNRYDALFFSNHQIGRQAGLELMNFLLKDQQIKHVILSNTGLGDGIISSEFAKAALADLLKVNHVIGWLVLNGNLISDIGAKALAAGLKKNKGIKHLILSDNDITEEGLIALVNALRENTTIETIFLQGNPLNRSALLYLNDHLSELNIRLIDLRQNHCLDNAVLSALVEKGQDVGIEVRV